MNVASIDQWLRLRRRLLAAGAAGAFSWLASAATGGVQRDADAAGVRRGRALVFPRDHGAHPLTRIEWWYVTGWLTEDAAASATERAASGAAPAGPTHGFQITFFRSRVPASGSLERTGGEPPASRGRFEPSHLLFAHAALTDLAAGRHVHAQRIARWNGDGAASPDRAALADADVRIGRWWLRREATGRWTAAIRSDAFTLQLTMASAEPPLLQGDAGFSRKGPEERHASHYYSLPQLHTELTLEVNGQQVAARGRAWLDHEWSDELMPSSAVGWDWIGINLLDGSALTAFRLRRADGSTAWAGGSWRGGGPAGSAGVSPSRVRSFEPAEVHFEPRRRWRSAATHASYPVVWQVRTPAGTHTVRALLEGQELASRGGTGAVYWEGIAELLDDGGRRVGLGYLEMTGYAAPLKLG